MPNTTTYDIFIKPKWNENMEDRGTIYTSTGVWAGYGDKNWNPVNLPADCNTIQLHSTANPMAGLIFWDASSNPSLGYSGDDLTSKLSDLLSDPISSADPPPPYTEINGPGTSQLTEGDMALASNRPLYWFRNPQGPTSNNLDLNLKEGIQIDDYIGFCIVFVRNPSDKKIKTSFWAFDPRMKIKRSALKGAGNK